MTSVDYVIFGLYMAGVLGVGFYHFLRNKSTEDYYVGSRSIKASHVGLSIVATDVGGGFSIGLGGVGFLMGLAGSWLLFTGLIGAWLTAVFIIPKIKLLDKDQKFMTYPDFLRHRYNGKVALVAAIISGIGYLGFTGAQLLAGAKLASATILPENPFGIEPIKFALFVIAVVTILYTVIGGLKAVIYTDTIQWIMLLSGLIFVTIPATLIKIGGISALKENLPAEYFSLTNIKPVMFINWMVTIIPIWLIGMTLYQRMYACKDVNEAKKAWYIAGIFEYPIMAFTGVFLGMCARVVFPEAEAEMALPMLIRDVLPVGVTGIVIASYFSAIMSTADSCLMASSGNFVNDIIERYFVKNISEKTSIRLSMVATFIIGLIAVIIAAQFGTVLKAILYAYSFMVSGLFIPTLGAYFWKRSSSAGAVAGMLAGGVLTLLLLSNILPLPERIGMLGLDSSIFGIFFSLIIFISVSLVYPDKPINKDLQDESGKSVIPKMTDKTELFHNALIQHGPLSNRIYLMKLKQADPGKLINAMDDLAVENGYTKIFAKLPACHSNEFLESGYQVEAKVPDFYNGNQEALFLGRYLDSQRRNVISSSEIDKVLEIAEIKKSKFTSLKSLDEGAVIRKCTRDDAEDMGILYSKVFSSYPFPIDDPNYIAETMEDNFIYFGIEVSGKLVSLASAEMDIESKNAEMTDFATLPEYQGNSFAGHLLKRMEKETTAKGIETAYTIARANSFGMNITFGKAGYDYGGRLINNTNIGGQIECMNVWYKAI